MGETCFRRKGSLGYTYLVKRIRSFIVPIALLLLMIAIVWGRLFYPTAQLILTPDFGRSDAWDFSFGMKYALWEALQKGGIPFWHTAVGNGFPLFAEGQIGALFLPNLLLFLLPDPVLAYNTALVVTILLFMLGMYWWARVLGFSTVTGLYAAVTLGFSGPVIVHMTHITLLQGMSLFPMMAAVTYTLSQRPMLSTSLFLGVLGAQQLFAGFPQASFLTIVFCACSVLYLSPQATRIRALLSFGVACVFILGLAAIQLVPSWEFLSLTTHPEGFDPNTASYFSFPLKHLGTFVFPFALGNPKTGTYPPFFTFDGSIFWENTVYIGVIPLVLAALALRSVKTRIVQFSLGASLLGMLFAWGKYSPIYFLYSFWPLNLFRVPSRFIWIAVIGLILLSMVTLEQFAKKKAVSWYRFAPIILVAIHVVILLFPWRSYHMLVPAADWLAKPESTRFLGAGRVYTIGANETYNRFFIPSGWTQTEPYHFLRNGLPANGSIVWSTPQYEVTSGRRLRRMSAIDDLFGRSFTVQDTQATASANAYKLLNTFTIGTVLSHYTLTQDSLMPITTLSIPDANLHILRNPAALARIRLVPTATVASTLREAVSIFEDNAFDPARTIILEAHEQRGNVISIDQTQQPALISPIIETLVDTHHQLSIRVTNNPAPSYLVIADTQYPGWKATINGSPTQILTANLVQRAVLIPAGNHEITLKFQPKRVITGAMTSGGFLVLTILLGVGSHVFGSAHRQRTTHLRGKGLQRSLGR